MKEYKYTISPTNYGYVIAEIYYEADSLLGGHSKIHILVISKKFGKWYRSINNHDYSDAQKWVDNHLENISRVNTEQSTLGWQDIRLARNKD